MNKTTVIHWFRNDLRLTDNPALFEAAKTNVVLPVFILDDVNSGDYKPGSASRLWLHHSLTALNQQLNGKLSVYSGDPEQILLQLIREHNIKGVYWNRCYEPWQIQRDQKLKQCLHQVQVEVQSYNGSLLWEPWDALKDDGTPYKVFTAFYKRGCMKATPPRRPLQPPTKLEMITDKKNNMTIDSLGLLPGIRWDKGLIAHWQTGEQAAQQKLQDFLANGLVDYKDGRNFPAKKNVSRLSPHLHYGEISPNQVWYAANDTGQAGTDLDHFLSELGWREFSYSLLYYFPDLPKTNLQEKFNTFNWYHDPELIKYWQQGQTGYPIVDAGMRELWQTGYMHNRVRMIVGSFLVKNLLLHWHHGERWFWDCLIDADLANNSASWQWIAGCGADAAPYFRIFNPVTQGKKFDPGGDYTLQYIPELKGLPDKYLFCPWEAPADVLAQAGVKLGDTYPEPVVDLAASRERALQAFSLLKKTD